MRSLRQSYLLIYLHGEGHCWPGAGALTSSGDLENREGLRAESDLGSRGIGHNKGSCSIV